MNIILFTADEVSAPLPRSDARAAHLLDVLRRREGDVFDAGLIDGPRGKGTLTAITPDALLLTFVWDEAPPPPPPIALIVGLPRPQTARKILNEATTLGVAEIHFAATERGEPSYARSTLWSTGEYRRHLVAGAAQAFCTRLPRVTWTQTLAETLAALPTGATRIALDNYEAPQSLSLLLASLPPPPAHEPPRPLALALGSERGWTSAERGQLRAAGFVLAHLGARVLRTETAAIAAVTLARAHLGLM